MERIDDIWYRLRLMSIDGDVNTTIIMLVIGGLLLSSSIICGTILIVIMSISSFILLYKKGLIVRDYKEKLKEDIDGGLDSEFDSEDKGKKGRRK